MAEALVGAGLAARASTLGRVILFALPPGHTAEMVDAPLSPLPSPLLAEFDAAMADIDRLLARQDTGQVT